MKPLTSKEAGIVRQFKVGGSMRFLTIGTRYNRPDIEAIIRRAMILQDQKGRKVK